MLSLVIPVYLNEASLPRLLDELRALAPRLKDGLEVVFVVDGSPDGSLALLRQQLPGLSFPSQLVELSRNFGSFAAIGAGLRAARGTWCAVVSADLQEPPELVLEFERVLAAGEADVVFGYRERRSDPALTRAFSQSFWWLYRRFVVPDMPRGGVDVFACSRQVRDEFVEMREATTNLVALLLWLGFRRAFIPYVRRPRLEGRSAWTLGRRLRYAVDSTFAFTDLPIRVLLVLGAIAFLGSVAGAVTVAVAWASGLVPVLGYTPLMLAITAFGGLTALGLGIVGEYQWLTLQNSRNRPASIVRRVDAFAPRPDSANP